MIDADQPTIETCTGCGASIGDHQARNVIWYCDRANGEQQWCGRCFETTPCGKLEHGEGCATMAIHVPHPDTPALPEPT